MSENDKKYAEMLTVEWVIEGKALLMEVKGPPAGMEMEEFTRAEMDEILAYQDRLIIEKLDAAAHPVQLIINMPATDKHPPAKDVTSLKFQEHPRLDSIILVGLSLNPIARFMMTIVSKVRRVQVKSFNTLNEALAYVNRIHVK